MIKLANEDLKRIKAIQLDIMEDIDRLCEEESIDYSLAYGTLIGAVRHQGYIPWDDDIDIVMLREDYERFLRLAEEKLSDKFYVVHYKNCEGYGLTFAKVMARNTIMKETSVVHASVPQGVFVDVIPIDCSPELAVSKKIQYLKAVVLRKGLLLKANYDLGSGRSHPLVDKVIKTIVTIFSKKMLIQNFEKNARLSQGSKKTKQLVCLCFGRLQNETFNQEDFENYVQMEFEGHKFKAISAYHKHLTSIYGDYMKLPPIEQREPHHYVEEISLSEYI